MDLTPNEEQNDLVRLAAEILGDAADRATSDADLWRDLARAGLLGVGVPEEFGGLGLGFGEVGLLLEEAGRTATSVPLLDSCGVASMVVRDLGRDDQRRALLPRLTAGDTILATALTEPAGDPLVPLLAAEGGPGDWVLTGPKGPVPAASGATHLLVSAHLAGAGPRLLVLNARRPGLAVTGGTGHARLSFDGLRVGPEDVLGEIDDARAVPLAVRYATAAACSVMAGALSRMVRLTADYVTTREQFGRPIGSFQAVGQRAADAFSAAWSVELTARQACWWVTDAGPDAARAVAVAKHTAATAGARVVRAAHHLHGGIGLDRDYPLQRYTLLTTRLEHWLGGGSRQAELLGDLLAAAAVDAVRA